MSSELYSKIYNFLVTANQEHITAISVIYQGIEEDPWISQNDLRRVVDQAIGFASNLYTEEPSRQLKLLRILPQFEIAFEGVCSLRDIGAVKTNKERPLNSDEIKKNINELKAKLKKNTTTPINQHLYFGIDNVNISELSWMDPLASQVISDESEIVKKLPGQFKHTFMKPVRQMVPLSLPSAVKRKCNEFVATFIENREIDLSRKLIHDGTWKETENELAIIAERILDTFDSWNNPAFGANFVESLNEGTYVTNVIVPAIRATLKNLPLGKSTFVSSSERQSSASADRKGDGRSGRRPDVMIVMKHNGKNYELLFTECSRLSCTAQKERDDQVKLWREVNDGMYWTRKSCKPDKDEFGIIGVQIAGKKLYLSILIRDMSEVH
ncbi:unnamed protein product [Rhizophagus irregularis]|nr:unnamed protein product [Rhizophagus irregularis]